MGLGPSYLPALPGSGGNSIPQSNSFYLSSGMCEDLFGPIPNLQFGYLYTFGKDLNAGRLTVDYLRPFSLGPDSVLFGEARGEFTNFWQTVQRIISGGNADKFDTRTDISVGGGYRRILNEQALVGVNGFFDAMGVNEKWYASGGVGVELATLLAGNDALDFTFNWYGNPFRKDVLANAFKRGPSNFDIQIGYSHELFNEGPDLRLFGTAYKFAAGYGWRTGAELKSRDGALSLKYEAAHDRVNSTYHTIGGFVNVGLELEKLASGESPFVMPEPLFKSPRNLRRWFTRKVQRNPTQTTGATYFVLEIDPGLSPVPTYYSWPVLAFAGTSGHVTFPQRDTGYSNAAWTLSIGGDTSGLPETIRVTITGETNGVNYYFGPYPTNPVLNVTLSAPSYSYTQLTGGSGVPYAGDSSPAADFPLTRTMRIADNAGNIPDLVIYGRFLGQ